MTNNITIKAIEENNDKLKKTTQTSKYPVVLDYYKFASEFAEAIGVTTFYLYENLVNSFKYRLDHLGTILPVKIPPIGHKDKNPEKLSITDYKYFWTEKIIKIVDSKILFLDLDLYCDLDLSRGQQDSIGEMVKNQIERKLKVVNENPLCSN